MIPEFDSNGFLPPGLHEATWEEFSTRFGFTRHRQKLLKGLRKAIESLKKAGCKVVYIDGSFVTKKQNPNDYDGCWEIDNVDPSKIDPILLKFDNQRTSQKAKYLGELFPAQFRASITGKTYLEFFQVDKDTGNNKGIIVIKLEGI